MPPKGIYIIKADGVRELFDRNKLEKSLRKIGTEQKTVDLIVSEVEANLKEGHTTKEIYRQAFTLLKKHQRPVALRYSLKKAIAELGPSGFPFERYVAEIFRAQGYETLTGQIVMGRCVPHEVDVVAWNEKELILIEAKFHTDYGARSDLKVALYIKARFEDIADSILRFGGKERKMTKGMLITNTKFSSTASQYGECAHLNMVGWNYPHGNNFHQMIEGLKLIPITALTTLNQTEKKLFLANNIVLSKQLGDFGLLKSYGFDDIKARSIVKEVYDLCEECVRPEELKKINESIL
ncbi:MAG: restriction endonuclease [Candidatus Paceibacterota bacterium]